MRCLVVNSSPAQCSIYESGKMVYDILKSAQTPKPNFDRALWSWIRDIEIKLTNDPADLQTYKPDVCIVNYHDVVNNFDESYFKAFGFSGRKVAYVLELGQNNPLCRCPQYFDKYMVPDPSFESTDSRFVVFPRPIITYPVNNRNLSDPIVVGTFGFNTHGKNWAEVAKAVLNDFGSAATLRLNIPKATYVPNHWNDIEPIKEACQRAAPSLSIIYTQDYMTQAELTQWCADNTLNVFLYKRPEMVGLAACTDQAIASGQPLAVSADPTFRHLHKYLSPWPQRSLKDSLATAPVVQQIRKDWSLENYIRKFKELLDA